MTKWTLTLAALFVLTAGLAGAVPVGVTLGDANLDGVADAADVQLINQMAVGVADIKGDAAWAADINQDGIVNLEDAKALQGYLDGESAKDCKAVPVLWLPLAAGLGLAGYVAVKRREA